MQQEEPGSRRNIPFIADSRRGTGRRDQLDGGSRSEEKAAGQPLPICCKFGKDETAAAGSAGQDQRHREPPAGRKVKRYFRKKKRGCGAVSAIFFRKKAKYFLPFRCGDIIGGGVYMTPCPPAAPAAALCNPPAGSGETRRGKIRPCPTKTLFSFSGTCWGAVPKPGGLSAGNARLYIHAPSLPKRKQRFLTGQIGHHKKKLLPDQTREGRGKISAGIRAGDRRPRSRRFSQIQKAGTRQGEGISFYRHRDKRQLLPPLPL